MRLVTYNLRAGGSPQHWEHLAADVAFVQETNAHPEGALPQTLRWTGYPTYPYHCDGVFLPVDWGSRIESADVASGRPWDSLSDHYPVTVDCS